MNAVEARVRCLELAERVMAREDDRSVDAIVKTAEGLYAFCADPEPPTPAEGGGLAELMGETQTDHPNASRQAAGGKQPGRGKR